MKLIAYEKQADLAVVLGIENDPERDRFLQMVNILKENDIEVVRLDSVKNKEFFRKGQILPSFELDGELLLSGAYPSIDDICSWFDLSKDLFASVERTGSLVQAANDDRLGYCCGVGTDVYLDPNEEEND